MYLSNLLYSGWGMLLMPLTFHCHYIQPDDQFHTTAFLPQLNSKTLTGHEFQVLDRISIEVNERVLG
jgi:hypothetical protein